MRIVASMDDDGRRGPTAATGPHPRKKSIQQSTTIICEGITSLNLEYTMFINIFMAYLVVADRRIVEPALNPMRWLSCQCRALTATATTHRRCIRTPWRLRLLEGRPSLRASWRKWCSKRLPIGNVNFCLMMTPNSASHACGVVGGRDF